ncbi:MAG TPA: biotin/lipoyl-binding protein, partial [Stellaceae bacterium]|nr:biotin/lipoyl-binding protein [Stellaceae bacterium]
MTPKGDDHTESVPIDAASGRVSPSFRKTAAIGIAILVLALGIGIYRGVRDRAAAETELTRVTDQAAIPTVAVVKPEGSPPDQEIVLPGNVQAYADTPIYARASGYLRHWYFDIGAHVKAGDLLAEIETPEVDEQLRQAQADLATAQANLSVADVTWK